MGRIPQKTYQINSLDRYYTEPSSAIPVAYPTPVKKKIRRDIGEQLSSRQKRFARFEKSPGFAAWMSSLVWGSGQIYGDSMVMGLYFFMVQALWLGALVMTYLHPQALYTFWKGLQMNDISLLYLGTIFSVIMSCFWLGNIFHAYRKIDRSRKYDFEGADSFWFMVLGSFWFPGMGQVLNGQPRKGFFFMLLPFLTSILITASILSLNLWPVLKDANALLFGEFLISAMTIVLGLTMLMGIWAFYDAAKVNLYPGIRDSLWRRLKFSWNRFRRDSFWEKVKAIPRFCFVHFVFLLLLGFAIHTGWQFLPKGFYSKNLAKTSSFLKNQRMTLIPPVIEHTAHLAKEMEEMPKPIEAYTASYRNWRLYDFQSHHHLSDF